VGQYITERRTTTQRRRSPQPVMRRALTVVATAARTSLTAMLPLCPHAVHLWQAHIRTCPPALACSRSGAIESHTNATSRHGLTCGVRCAVLTVHRSKTRLTQMAPHAWLPPAPRAAHPPGLSAATPSAAAPPPDGCGHTSQGTCSTSHPHRYTGLNFELTRQNRSFGHITH
jgi:hypothetical protein